MDLPGRVKNQKRVVIVGAGFAGLTLAKRLSSKYFQVVLLDKNNYHQFQPLLYQVATCGLEPSNISFPLRKVFRKQDNIFIRVADVESIDAAKHSINTSIGTISYDYLVLAHGSTTNFFQNMQLQKNAYSMKSVSEALLLRNTLLQNYERALIARNESERSALLNIVIVGGGPTGVELAGAIAEMKMKILPKDYTELNFAKMQIFLLDSMPGLLNGMSPVAGMTVEGYLAKLGIEVKTNTILKDYDGENVVLSGGETIKSKCVVMAAGVLGAEIGGIPESSLAPNKRIRVDVFNRILNAKDVFAIGDIALMPRPDYPKGHPQVAQVAIQQAKLLAKNLGHSINSEKFVPFKYVDKGSMATVGHNKAVAQIGRLKLRGFLAWFVWMFIHLISLIGFKNRIFVFINWVWQYFTYDPSLRMIIKPAEKSNKIELFKRAAIIGILTIAMLSCSSSDHSEKYVPEQPADSISVSPHNEELTLNNGLKWKADSVTDVNVNALRNIITSEQPDDVEKYRELAKRLQAQIDKMVADCRMKGKDHEALHKWLEPLMEMTQKMAKVETKEAASNIYGQIKAHIELYTKYFEL